MSFGRKKTPKESFTSTTQFVLPNDTNTLNNLMGGQLMHWMDLVGAICAQKHSNRIVVTASVDTISFKEPTRLGEVVTLEAKVTRSFNTSMEIHIIAWSEDVPGQHCRKTNEAFFTFVAVDQIGRPIPVPEVQPETEEEVKLYEGALRRRQVRLILAGKMKPSEANELAALFEQPK